MSFIRSSGTEQSYAAGEEIVELAFEQELVAELCVRFSKYDAQCWKVFASDDEVLPVWDEPAFGIAKTRKMRCPSTSCVSNLISTDDRS